MSNFDVRFVRVRGVAVEASGGWVEGKTYICTADFSHVSIVSFIFCYPAHIGGGYSLVLDFREPAPGRWMKSGEFTALQFLVGLEIWPRLGQV